MYHVSVIGVRFARSDIAGVLPHLPVSRRTLDASVIRLTTTKRALPTTAADEGIAEWRRARGGVFTISLAQIADVVEATVATPPQPGASDGYQTRQSSTARS